MTARTRAITHGESGWRTSTSSGLASRRAKRSCPAIVLQADGGVTGAFRVLCDGDHDESAEEAEEEYVDAVAEQDRELEIARPAVDTPPPLRPPV